jgi:hypothetical protein
MHFQPLKKYKIWSPTIFLYRENFKRLDQYFKFENKRYDVKYKNILYYETNRNITFSIYLI